MKIEENKVVTISYVVQENDQNGAALETMDLNYPFQFMFGGEKLLPAFEAELKGLKEGDRFEFKLTAEQAYGPRYDENIVDVPRSAFSDELLQEDSFVNLTDDLGEQHNGQILSWTDDSVKVDLNHAMAGKNLFFRGVVLNVREATTEELNRKSNIVAGGVHRPD